MEKQTEAEAILQNNLDYTFFSWTKQAGLNPINVERAKGVYLYDRSGKRYIDFSSQLINVNIGHGRHEVTEAVVKQMQQLSYVAPGFATKVRGDLGKKLAEITPGNLSKTFFTLGGAEAIENAIKLARLYTGRHKIITQYRAYHGATYSAMSAGGDPRKLLVDSQQVPNIIHVENPYSYRCPWYSSSPAECGERAIENLHNVLKYEGPENVAAILMEGESGTSGCIKYPPFYLKKVKALCEQYGILFISDEVMSGFGRTGKWFGVDHHEITPDILVMAKGLTSGYLPLGGIITTDTIARQYDENYLPLGLTYSAHPVSVAAALAVLDIYEKEDLINRTARMEGYVNQSVAKLIEKHPSIGDWRNTGLLGCMELVKNRKTKEPMAPYNATPSEMGAMSKVAAKIRSLGMFTFVRWNFIFVCPPLTVTEAEVDEGMAILSEAIALADEAVML
ncbi:MAG: aminotransferase class III-fold pyridoxal phosphate-dependent enzyme [Saprospiraceae bacterium]|nr:aminotransferase class III-fold pyridoxal phosphate-dependent enzyme [Saprospiraceae bacterium]MCB9323149.1 aminotransferase class III-fold pyridoxal phosphate-dependent enzyme [Lewinellaceae bacterium]